MLYQLSYAREGFSLAVSGASVPHEGSSRSAYATSLKRPL